MIWYSVEDDFPLDTLNRPSLWLWDGENVVQGGFAEGSVSPRKNRYWFDLNFQPFPGVLYWREIMPEDVEPPEPPDSTDQGHNFPLPRGSGGF